MTKRQATRLTKRPEAELGVPSREYQREAGVQDLMELYEKIEQVCTSSCIELPEPVTRYSTSTNV